MIFDVQKPRCERILKVHLYLYMRVVKGSGAIVSLRLGCWLNKLSQLRSRRLMVVFTSDWYKIDVTDYLGYFWRLNHGSGTLELDFIDCAGCVEGNRVIKPNLAYTKRKGKVIRRRRFPFLMFRQKKVC